MSGWIAVQRDVMINHDLENSPLQIRTESAVGSNEEAALYFYSVEDHYIGGVGLYFTSPPQFWLFLCTSSKTDFPSVLPTETDKIWTITLIKTAGAVHFMMHCNNKEVLNVVLSDTICGQGGWISNWSRDVENIKFSSRDTASDYYRPGKFLMFLLMLAPIPT